MWPQNLKRRKKKRPSFPSIFDSLPWRFFKKLITMQIMATVMESISDSILAIGLQEEILFANQQFKKNFFPKEMRKKEIHPFKIWEITQNAELKNLFNECLLKGDMVKKRNVELSTKRGKRKLFFDIKVNPLLNQKGEVFGAVGVFHDVTERKLADQMREDFVANVSHEIRTPLTAIKGHAQIICQTPPEKMETVAPFFKKLEVNADRLTNLFNDILQLSVIESTHKVMKETLFPEEITDNVIMNIRQSYMDKEIKIHSLYELERIWGNPPFLEQLLTNLIENAYKYTPHGGEIFISWKKSNQDKGEKWDILRVRNTGIGIPKECRSRLFERFYRVDSGRSRQMGGTGLGLAIVKHIVNIHSGKISVDSKEEKETLFTVKLPAHYQ